MNKQDYHFRMFLVLSVTWIAFVLINVWAWSEGYLDSQTFPHTCIVLLVHFWFASDHLHEWRKAVLEETILQLREREKEWQQMLEDSKADYLRACEEYQRIKRLHDDPS